jgi:hypothetical protein
MSDQLPVRVWLARRKEGMAQDEFLKMLRGEFVPITVQWLTPLGLQAYFPTLVPENPKRQTDPHEIALVFYASTEIYDTSRLTTTGRLYGKAHSLLFETGMSKGWPKPWTAGISTALGSAFHSPTPSGGIDWNQGQVAVFMLRWPNGLEGADWVERHCLPSLTPLTEVRQWIAFARDDYIIVWANLPETCTLTAESLRQALTGSTAGLQVVFAHMTREELVTAGPTDIFPGVTFSPDESIHVVLRIPPEPPADS